MTEEAASQLLQIVALSLPFLALYLGVLVEIHKLPRPMKGTDYRAPEGSHIGERSLGAMTIVGESEWVGAVNKTYAYQHWDFIFALISILIILLSGLFLGGSLVVNADLLLEIGSVLLAVSFIFAGASIVATLYFCYDNFSPSED